MNKDSETTGPGARPIRVSGNPGRGSQDHFVALTEEAIREVLRYGPRFVEAGAGTGHDAALMERCGADIVCYDAAPPDQAENKYFLAREHLQHRVQKNCPHDHGYVNQEGRTLLLIWPPMKDRMAEEVLKAYTGKWFVYIGEERNGANAEANFFDLLEKDYIEVDRVPTKTVRGQEIAVFIHRRKRPGERSERRTGEISASVSRAVGAEIEERNLRAGEALASKIAVAAITAATQHAGANARDSMDTICRETRRGVLENLPHD